MKDIKIAAQLTKNIVYNSSQSINWPKEGPLSYTHVLNMLNKIQNGEISDEKAHRWLGWAQCAVVSANCASLDEMKKINENS